MKALRSSKTALAVMLIVLAAMLAVPASVFADEIPEADQFGKVDMYSTSSAGAVLKDSYRFSDKWFKVDPAEENTGIALLSMQLVSAAVDNDADGLGGDFLSKLGFDGIGYYGDPDLAVKDCNYTYGTKKLDDGTTLVAVAIQSYAFDKNGKMKGWPQNFEVNGETSEGEHYALSKAAEAVLPAIAAIGGEGDVRYWITGQSRGGALAGLLAAKLPAELGTRNKGIYAYTFESPQVAQPKDEAERVKFMDDYKYIHNYVCSDDLVPIIPPWGMVRYGVDHMLDTNEANENLEKELKKIGSSAEIPEDYNREKAREKVEGILTALLRRIPSREEYSADHTETVKLADGTEKVITYNYQDLLGKLLANVFGGALDEADLAAALDYLTEAMAVLEKYIRGYLAECKMLDGDPDPMLFYWEAACEVNPFLKEKLNVDLGLTDEELYAVLKLAAPAIIDKDAGDAIGYDPNSSDDMPVLAYLAPALSVKSILFSHHFDTIIARLHTLAPEPAVSDLDLDVAVPQASDPATRMPRKIKTAVAESASGSWLTASAEWLTSDKTLRDKNVYYLNVKFTAAGHDAPDDLRIRINGEEPIVSEVTYKGGMTVIDAIWKYTFGEPRKYVVTYDAGEQGESPDPAEIEAGTILRYTEKPADPVAAGYRFVEWRDLDDKKWDEVTVTANKYFNAVWVQQIDKVAVNFKIPRVGEKWTDPTVSPKAPYRIEEIYLVNRQYDDITVVKKKEKLELSFYLRMITDKAEFLTEMGDYERLEYKGTVTINGKEVEAVYSEGSLQVTYEFTPLPKKPKLSKTSITVKKGKTAKVKIIGKEKGSRNTYKNTKKAKIVSKKTASTIKVKGLKKGNTTLKIKSNGVWLKLKVKVK